MIFKWETGDERIRRFMSISPRRKMEWLHEMHEFMIKFSSTRTKAIRRKIREMR